MYLKRLKVRNFKSFAGATEIPFEPGFTGVAGPNGMGKSNISDAILFVLGPTSSKALRADRLTHLFFNGGAAKKPATECEVTLVFDNADRLLPVESNEVSLTRYVKLAPNDPDGYYSYFYLNGKRSTQGDIDALLAHARLSGDGYNLVQQGDVNRIVSMGPIPRRTLVERLAGIAQYDDELGRAEGKRVELETNLGRIGTLLTEIRGRLNALEGQRLQAIQYRDIQDQKRRNEARLARAGHLVAEKEAQTSETQLARLNREVEELTSEATRLEAERDAVVKSIDEVEQEIARKGGAEAAKFKQELDDRRMAFARLDENLRQLGEADGATRTKAESLLAQSKLDEKERGRLSKLEKELAGELSGLTSELAKNRESLDAATGTSETKGGALVGARREVLELERRQAELEKGWPDAVQELESVKAALDSTDRELGQAEDDHRSREIELKDLELRAKPTGKGERRKASAADLNRELLGLRSKEKLLTEATERLSLEVLESNRRYMALDARLKAQAQSGRAPGGQMAVDYLLSQRNLGKIGGIRGTVEELAQVDPAHQTALGVAAGSRFQALVVETDQVAEECIKLLRNEKRGRATFLPLNKILPGRPRGKSLLVAQSDGSLGFAIDLVKFDESLRPAFWYVFGETIVMKELGSARAQMGGVRLVTLQGDLIEATGAISGGYLDPGARGRGGDNAAELKRLGDELRAKSAEESASREELRTLGEKVRALADELAKRTAESQAQSGTLQLIEEQLASARSRLKSASERIKSATRDREKADARRSELEASVARLRTELDEVKQRLAAAREAYHEKLPEALGQKLRTLQAESERLREEQVALTGQLEATRASLAALGEQIQARQTERSGVDQEIVNRSAEQKRVQSERDAAKAALDTLRTVEAKQLEAAAGLLKKKAGFEAKRLELVEKLTRAQTTLTTRRSIQHDAEVKLETARAHLAELQEALKQFPEPEPDEKPASVDELKRTIQTLEKQLESMGSVNLRALEEYDAEKKRVDEFEGETQRLTDEKTQLLALVTEIETKKKAKLTEVVASVNVGYREIYGELSGGGEGEIALENLDDPLAGGLTIRARPIGKNVQRLEQLSGGEKSLASLAFVFALQRHDPSPLYVFDEVDMSLDGLNAENVGRMLRRNAGRAQFIVISLRKVTLKFAHRLFGVTMHGDGVSRVVGLDLDEIVDVDERDRGAPPRVEVIAQ